MSYPLKFQSSFKSSLFERVFDLKWTIKNFCKIKYNIVIHSSQFYPINDLGWRISIVKDGNRVNDFPGPQIHKDQLLIKFEPLNEFNMDLIIDVKIYNMLGREITKPRVIDFNLNKSLNISLANLNFEEVTFIFSMQFSKVLTNRYNQQISQFHGNETLTTLSNDLKKMYLSANETDVTFKVSDVSFHAHKLILSTRYNITNKLLCNMNESYSKTIEIDDVEADIFKYLLDYLYSGVFPPTDFCTTIDIYKAAHKYDLFDICEICKDILLSKLSTNNVHQLLNLADFHDDKVMAKQVVEFIHFHMADILVTEDVRKILEKETLDIEIIKLIKSVLPRKLEENGDKFTKKLVEMINPNNIHTFLKTDLIETIYVFKWTIQPIIKMIRNGKVLSTQFKAFNESIWNVTLKMEDLDLSQSQNEIERASVFVQFEPQDPFNKELRISVTLLSDELLTPEVYFQKGYKVFSTSVTIHDLGNSKKGFLETVKDDTLTFVFSMEFTSVHTEAYNRHVTQFSQDKNLKSLSDDFQKLNASAYNTDVTFKVKEVIFPAHKLIVSMRSEVFKTMFTSNMKEGSLKTIEIDDIEPDIFKYLIGYLYSGILTPADFSIAHDLYYAANKYCLTELCDMCKDIMLSELSISNAHYLLSLADLHDDRSLLKKVVEFMEFHLSTIQVTDTVRKVLSRELPDFEIRNLVQSVFNSKYVNEANDVKL